jgi:hypothetical protein
MIAPRFATDYVINVHFAFICATDLAYATVTFEHAFALFAVTPAVQLV